MLTSHPSRSGNRPVRAAAAAAALVLAAGTASAQTLSLTTTFAGGNGQAGAMFDLTAHNTLTISGFDYALFSGGGPGVFQEIEVYYVTGRTSFVGLESDPSAWTLLGTMQVETAASPAPINVPIGGLTIAAGETIGIYFTRTSTLSTSSIAYTNGPLGAFSNADLTFEDRGVGKAYPFGSTFDPRVWNGTIYYELGGTVTTGACCLPSGACSETTELACTGQGGTYHGDNTDCATTPPGGCPQPPTGACCLPDGTCIIDWETGCLNQGGTYHGDGTDCATIPPCPSSIATSFTGTSSTSGAGAGAYFNVTALDPQGIVIERFEINSAAALGTPLTAHVYVTPNTFVGSETDPGAWALMGEVSTTAAGPGNPTPVEIGGFHIAPGEKWGLRVGTTSSGGIRYSSSTQTQPYHTNQHVELEMGLVQTALFGGSLFGTFPTSLRGWNGRLFYSLGATVTTGACCMPDGSCDEMREVICTGQGGTYHGDNTDCATTPPGGCPQPPTGACCLADGSCVTEWEGGCLALGGLYQGDNTDCATTSCPSRIDSHWGVSATQTTGSGAGAYFLVEATDPQGIIIDGFQIDTPAAANTQIDAHVYFRPNTFVGFHNDPSEWILMGEVQTTAAGSGNPTLVPVGGLHIAGGETWALRVGSSAGVRYTSSTNTTPIISDASVSLHMGEVQSSFFGATTFGTYPTSLRGWIGSMYYHVGATVTTGACCMPDGSCIEVREIACTGQGGTYHGDNTDCATTPPGGCPQPPTGACCLPDGTCSEVNIFQCDAANGFYHGDNTTCAGKVCPIIVISNMPGNDGTQSASLGSGRIKAMGFTMGPEEYILERIDMRLGISSLTDMPAAWIYDDAGGQPGSILVTLDTPAPTVTGDQTYTATAPQPFLLAPHTSYWLVVWASSGSVDWLANSPGITPTGIATHHGSLFAASGGPNPPHSGQTSSILNSYGVFGALADPPCYADCNNDGVLNVADFLCFIDEFAIAQSLPPSQQETHYANCNGATSEPFLSVADFLCFIDEFAQGCP